MVAIFFATVPEKAYSLREKFIWEFAGRKGQKGQEKGDGANIGIHPNLRFAVVSHST
jgi:hypothetical protein